MAHVHNTFILHAILSEVLTFSWFDLEYKVIGQKGGHVLVRK